MIKNKAMNTMLMKDALENYSDLTEREMEVMKYVWEGYFNNEIAKVLNISVKTVEAHRNHIMVKYNTNNMIQMIRIGLAKGIIKVKE